VQAIEVERHELAIKTPDLNLSEEGKALPAGVQDFVAWSGGRR
jgi:hypothetical protein